MPQDIGVPGQLRNRCPQCGKVFDTYQGMRTHQNTHKPGKGTKQPCPECGKKYTPGPGLTLHRMRMHGYQGNGKVAATAAPTKAAASVKSTSADDILNAVLKVIYSNGTLPIKDLAAWMQWRDATEALLRRVHA